MQCGKSCRRSNCDKFTLIGSWTVVESNNTLCVQRFWTLLAIFVSGSVQLSWRGWKPLCFGLRARIRKAQKLLRRGRWRRRSWRLLEGNAGDGNGRVLFALQVRYSSAFQGRSCLQLSKQGENMYFINRNSIISQRIGSCPSPSFLLWWPTQSSPLPSTTIGCRMMADFN